MRYKMIRNGKLIEVGDKDRDLFHFGKFIYEFENYGITPSSNFYVKFSRLHLYLRDKLFKAYMAGNAEDLLNSIYDEYGILERLYLVLLNRKRYLEAVLTSIVCLTG